MKYYGENRDILIAKRVYLVQSGHFKGNQNNKIENIEDIIDLNYMGSAEFDFGGLYNSLRRMNIHQDFYKVYIFEEYRDQLGNPLKIYAPQIYFENAKSIVERLAQLDTNLKENCSLHNHLSHSSLHDNDDFWWDIENDFFIFFTNTDKILKLMSYLKKKKFGYDEAEAKKAFSEFYLKYILIKETSFTSWQTSIKDYYYDEGAQIHFIEFKENFTFQKLLMEAMAIAKVNKGTVVFGVNKEMFIIDEDSNLESIQIFELQDICICSLSITDLITRYNEEIEKKIKQREFIQVLKLSLEKKN